VNRESGLLDRLLVCAPTLRLPRGAHPTTEGRRMKNRIAAALARVLIPRADDVHFHLDIDGEVLCEDSRCPHRRPNAMDPARLGSLRFSA
jgi:hypothetical protein